MEKDKPIITVEKAKELIIKKRNLYESEIGLTIREDILFTEFVQLLDTFADAKLPSFSGELIDFLELKLESEKSSFENYEINAPDDVFEDTEIKKLYHKDMKIVNDLTKLINYLKPSRHEDNKPDGL
jgi:hypothetical protein